MGIAGGGAPGNKRRNPIPWTRQPTGSIRQRTDSAPSGPGMVGGCDRPPWVSRTAIRIVPLRGTRVAHPHRGTSRYTASGQVGTGTSLVGICLRSSWRHPESAIGTKGLQFFTLTRNYKNYPQMTQIEQMRSSAFRCHGGDLKSPLHPQHLARTCFAGSAWPQSCALRQPTGVF